MKYGNFTVRGSAALEQRMTELTAYIVEVLRKNFTSREYRAVMITGGYGRGEGGVQTVNGVEKPHNNMDLVFVVKRKSAAQTDAISRRFQKLLLEVSARFGIDLDGFAIAEDKLRRLPCLVMLYDMRYGHKTILGDTGFFPSLKGFEVQNVLPSDIRNLMVNRGTLLLINRYILLHNPRPSVAVQKRIIKHIMKALIGYGDAILFSLGEYHWSYQEKQKRMGQQVFLPGELRRSYIKALDFRFAPDYEAYINCDLQAWNESILAMMMPWHLQFEAWRMARPSLTWHEYPVQVAEYVIHEDGFQGKIIQRKLRQILRPQTFASHFSLKANLGLHMTDSNSLMSMLFPLIAYNLKESRYQHWVEQVLESSTQELLKNYLHCWASFADPSLLNWLEESLRDQAQKQVVLK